MMAICVWSDWEWSMQSRLSRGPTARPIRSSAHSLGSEARPTVLPPPEKGLDAMPVFLWGGGRGGRWWAFAKLYVCTSILWMNIKLNKVIKKNMSGKRSSHTQLSWEKKGGADCVFPRCNTFRSRRACSEEFVHPCDLVVRSCYCWGTAAIEIMGIAHGYGGQGWRRARPISTCIPQI